MAKPFTLYKLIILYMLSKVDYPLTNSQISEFILDKEYTNYFHLQQSLSEMIDSKLLEKETIRNTSYYRITNAGNSTLDFFVNEIPPEIREEVNVFLKENGCQLREEVSAIADYYKSTVGEYAVRLQLKERHTQLIDMTVTVPTEAAAQAMCSKWPSKFHDNYGQLMETLL